MNRHQFNKIKLYTIFNIEYTVDLKHLRMIKTNGDQSILITNGRPFDPYFLQSLQNCLKLTSDQCEP